MEGGPGRGTRTQPGAGAESRDRWTWGAGGVQDRIFPIEGWGGGWEPRVSQPPSRALLPMNSVTITAVGSRSSVVEEERWATLQTLAGTRSLVGGRRLLWGLTPGPGLALLDFLRISTVYSLSHLCTVPYSSSTLLSSRQVAPLPSRTEIEARAVLRLKPGPYTHARQESHSSEFNPLCGSIF